MSCFLISSLRQSITKLIRIMMTSAWGAIYEISSQSVRPLTLITNSFCAGGGWLSNGSLVSVGGNPSTFGYDGNGLAAIRIFTPCPDNTVRVVSQNREITP